MSRDTPVPPLGAAWWLLTGELLEIVTAATAALWLTIIHESWRVAVPATVTLFLLAVLAKARGEGLDARARRLDRLDSEPPGKD